MAKREEYSIEDLNKLVESIKQATSLDENEIERAISRSYGYLAQTRSRGKVPVVLYKLLQITFKDTLQNTMNEPAGGYKNGNGNNGNGNDLAAAKDETINALKEHIQFLKGENERLRKQCESNLSGLHRYAQIVSARVQVIVECHKLLRAFAEQAKIDPKKIDAASEKVDRLFAATLQETIQSDKD